MKQKQRGITRKLAGFEVIGRGIARDGWARSCRAAWDQVG